MPRPCQIRRETTAAKKRSRPNPKPAGPPPIRHKARQKAVHNAARRGRGRGGGHSRNQRSGDGIAANQDFISFGSTGNNFNVLNGAGSRHDPIALDEGDSFEDGEITDSNSDSGDDSDMKELGALTINVEAQPVRGARPPRPTVMFPMKEALTIYRRLQKAGFPLVRPTRVRYGPHDTVAVDRSYATSSSNISPVSTDMSRQPSTSTAASGSTMGARERIMGRDYIFDFGVHNGRPFADVPDAYLRTLAGQPTLVDKHPGLKEAFDYYRPGMRLTAPTKRQYAISSLEALQAPSRGTRNQGTRGAARVPSHKPWTDYRFPRGAHMGAKLNEVSDNYLRTLEGMDSVMENWIGLREALQDYYAKTGRQPRGPR
ncbi:hypothetical protein CC86DRAFT_406997 [Ophiobolus disseminans]|uniref:Uncharacterized protein n=1 Tax=Ophiobolus disseminans TaxID=1469910 RepID=A0A6A6ZYY9_9PLEO|nr:hypothetical protein CC86DRAFT_406997 [Ophiobolus disseminans]